MSKLKPYFLVLLGLICIAMFYGILSHFENQKILSSPIRWIAQTGPIKEGLKTDYLSELLGLSVSSPKALDPEQAQKILRESPLIKEMEVSLLNPETLYIDYTLRQPCFFLGEFSNVVIDENGYPIPLRPFFTPKKLPELFLGLKSSPVWSKPIHKQKLHLAFDLMHTLEGTAQISRIDLSQIDSETLGKREIVLILDNENGSHHYLRLTLKGYEEELSHYFTIREKILTKSLVIDLRVSDLAFLSQLTG